MLNGQNHIWMPTDREAKLISLFFAAFVLLNFPIISILGNQPPAGGVPLLYIYLLILWVGIIFITYRIIQGKNKS